jgi:hypothetical protein
MNLKETFVRIQTGERLVVVFLNTVMKLGSIKGREFNNQLSDC